MPTPTFEQLASVRRLASPAWSPDGQWFAYLADTSGRFQLWLQPKGGGFARQLTALPGRRVTAFAWSRDGRRIAFAADLKGNETPELFVIDFEAGTASWPRQLTDRPEVEYNLAGWTADGRIVLSANDREPSEMDPLLLDPDSGEVERLMTGGLYYAAEVSRSGRWLTVIETRSNSDTDVHLVDLERGEARLVTQHEGDAKFYAGPWAPDESGFYLLTDAEREFVGLAFWSFADDGWRLVHQPERDVDGVGEVDAVGHEHGGGHDVVFGLADQVGGDVHGIGGAVGEDGDLGGAGLGVDPDAAAAQALGRGDVDVAGTGDHVDGCEFAVVGVGAAVGEQGDGLRSTDGPHLVDAEQCRRGEDRRVRQTAEVLLRRRGDHEGVHAGGLRRDDVHHHRRRVHRVAAGNVEPDTIDRDPAFGDRAAGNDLGDGIGAALIGVHPTGAFDGHFEGRTHVGIDLGEGTGEFGGGNADRGGTDTVELLAVLECGLGAAVPDVVDDGTNVMQHRVHVHSAAGQRAPQLRSGGRTTTQVGAGKHGLSSLGDQGTTPIIRDEGAMGTRGCIRPGRLGTRPMLAA